MEDSRTPMSLAASLSICIATRNRADFIGDTLASIAGQHDPSVEVVIADGASTDATPAVVGKWERRLPRLRYRRFEENGGFDRDLDRAVQTASGQYVWLMTDDDVLRPGSIAAVRSALAGGPALVVVNAEVRDATLDRVLEPARLRLAADVTIPESDIDRLFLLTADYLSYVGGVVIRRDLWMSRDRQAFYGSMFVHVGVLFQRPLDGPAIVLSEPAVTIRYGNAQWTPRAFEIWCFLWPRLVWSFSNVAETSRRRVVARRPWRRPATLLRHRAFGNFGLEEYRRFVRPAASTRERLVPLAIAAAPGALVHGVFHTAARLIYRKSQVPLADLESSQFCRRTAVRPGGKARA